MRQGGESCVQDRTNWECDLGLECGKGNTVQQCETKFMRMTFKNAARDLTVGDDILVGGTGAPGGCVWILPKCRSGSTGVDSVSEVWDELRLWLNGWGKGRDWSESTKHTWENTTERPRK